MSEPLQISDEARKCFDTIYELGLVSLTSEQDFEYLKAIQLAINSATTKLEQEKASLVTTLESTQTLYGICIKERDAAEQRVKELESQLAMANDAADKGEAGRKMGTAYEECQRELNELKARVGKYMEHQAFCDMVLLPGRFCNCGYQELKDTYGLD
jgi:chromosome segregation ATPase